MKRVYWILIAIAVIRTVTVTIYMFDDSHRALSPTPWDRQHLHGPNNLAPYIETALLAYENRGDSTLNVYAEDPGRTSSWARPDATQGGYNVGHYHYPPQFLLLPWAVTEVTPSFEVARGVWFLLEAAVVLLGLVLLARHVGGREGQVMTWMIPVFWLSLPLMFDFQVQNFQMLAFAGSILAMIAFERDKPIVGGALLAFTTLSKISPGILLLYLLVRRKWRALAWTAGFFVAYTVFALILFGTQPFAVFVHYELPRISSTEAFTFFKASAPFSSYYNFSILGAALKLELLGLPFDAWSIAPKILWVYTIALVGVTVLSARTKLPRLLEARVWLVLLAASELRSPMATQPQVYLGALWLLCTFAPRIETRSRWVMFGVAWLAFNAILPAPWSALGESTTALLTLMMQLAGLGLMGWVIYDVWRAKKRDHGTTNTNEIISARKSGPSTM